MGIYRSYDVSRTTFENPNTGEMDVFEWHRGDGLWLKVDQRELDREKKEEQERYEYYRRREEAERREQISEENKAEIKKLKQYIEIRERELEADLEAASEVVAEIAALRSVSAEKRKVSAEHFDKGRVWQYFARVFTPKRYKEAYNKADVAQCRANDADYMLPDLIKELDRLQDDADEQEALIDEANKEIDRRLGGLYIAPSQPFK